MSAFTESTVEEAALAWLETIGWQDAHGPDIAPDMPAAERADYGEVVLAQGLRDALARLNPKLPAEALEDAFRKLTRPEGTASSTATRSGSMSCWRRCATHGAASASRWTSSTATSRSAGCSG